MSIVSYIEYPSPEIKRREILRYMGCKAGDSQIDGLLDSCICESSNALSYKVVYTEVPILKDRDGIKLGEITIVSRDLQKCLSGCDKAIIFAATVGLGIDRLINKYGRINPSRAVCFQAIGAERIEALCDAFCKDVSQKYAEHCRKLRPRFSPGYGDLPLSLQRDIFNLLSCEKRIGLTLNDSLLMSPSKSVTAIVGIYHTTRKNDENT